MDEEVHTTFLWQLNLWFTDSVAELSRYFTCIVIFQLQSISFAGCYSVKSSGWWDGEVAVKWYTGISLHF